jgi:hypothetical protein
MLLSAGPVLAGEGVGADDPEIHTTFRLFGDAGFSYESRPPAGGVHSSFAVGSIDFFASAQIEERVRVLAEAVVEFESTTNEARLDLERLWGSYTLNDHLYFKLGRERSPLSRWGRRYHHGHLFWPSVTKPFLARFEDEGGLLPIYQVGLEIGGRAQTGAGGVEYEAVLSNGRGVDREDITNAGDRNEAKAVQAGAGFAPARFPGLSFGVDLYNDTIPSDPVDPSRARSIGERISESYLEFRGPRVEVLAEAAIIDHDDRTSGQSFEHRSAYVHLVWHKGAFSPYGRLDLRLMEQGDPFYAPGELDRWEQVFGLRYDLGDSAAVKLEAGFGRAEERDATSGLVTHRSVSSVAFQLAWGY